MRGQLDLSSGSFEKIFTASGEEVGGGGGSRGA